MRRSQSEQQHVQLSFVLHIWAASSDSHALAVCCTCVQLHVALLCANLCNLYLSVSSDVFVPSIIATAPPKSFRSQMSVIRHQPAPLTYCSIRVLVLLLLLHSASSADRLHKFVEGAAVSAAAGVAYPHTSHCLGSGEIMISTMGGPDGKVTSGAYSSSRA